MAPQREWDIDCKVYIGGLSEETNKYDLEDAFSRYGRVKAVWVARRPPGFGFIEMEDPRDAEDAVRSLDGTRIAGSRVRVEMSNGKSRERGGRGGGEGGGRRDRRSRTKSRSRSRERERRRSPSYRSMSRGRRSRSRSRS